MKKEEVMLTTANVKIDDKEIKGLTDKICNIYGERRYDFLRELYETNRR